MDNASKALIMAGAILLAASIIGVGAYILSSTNLMTDAAINQINPLVVTAVNSQLQPYEGEIKGSALKQLINMAKSVNARDSISEKIKFSIGESTYENALTIEKFKASNVEDDKDYEVNFSYSNTGYINLIMYEEI